MPLIDDEASAYNSRAVELYEFTADGQSWYLTRHPLPYDFGGDTYLPSPKLHRRNVVRAAVGDKPPELIIDIAESEPMIQATCFDFPPVEHTVRIHRIQPNGSHTWWDGTIGGGHGVNDRFELRCPSIFDDTFKNEVPGVHFQAQCQHFLFDGHCRLDPLDYAVATTVSNVSSDGLLVTVGSVAGAPDIAYYRGGVMLSESGEYRLIVQQDPASPHTGMTMFSPFKNIAVGQDITIYAGCDRKIRTCVEKFDNKDNFGGFPLIPVKNLFRSGFRLAS